MNLNIITTCSTLILEFASVLTTFRLEILSIFINDIKITNHKDINGSVDLNTDIHELDN